MAGQRRGDEGLAEYADYLTEISSSERLAAVLPIDIGDWSGKGIRTMAIESGLKDLYDLWYSPLSAAAHAEWMSLRGHYAQPCGESCHPRHWIPNIEHPERRPEVTGLFTQFLLMTVETAGQALGIEFVGLEGVPDLIDRAGALMREASTSSNTGDAEPAH